MFGLMKVSTHKKALRHEQEVFKGLRELHIKQIDNIKEGATKSIEEIGKKLGEARERYSELGNKLRDQNEADFLLASLKLIREYFTKPKSRADVFGELLRQQQEGFARYQSMGPALGGGFR